MHPLAFHDVTRMAPALRSKGAYASGGGLPCCTADVYREGECEDYFPKQ